MKHFQILMLKFNFIGDLGTKYIKSDVGCVTSSFKIAMSLLVQETDNFNKVFLDSFNDLHFIRIKNKQPKYNTGLPIHRHIIYGGIINLCNLYEKVKTPIEPIIRLIKIKNRQPTIHNNIICDDIINLCNSYNKIICFNTDSIMIKGKPHDDVFKYMTETTTIKTFNNSNSKTNNLSLFLT